MKELMKEFKAGMAELSKSNPEEFKKFSEFMSSVHKEGKLTEKTKELIALAISVAIRCSYCIGVHTENAFKAGATKEEMLEAATVSVLMGGGPALTYIAELKKAIDLYENQQ
jgi:AhpD family alkylhydroperoxidase